jgi:hypothetical protein
VTATIKSEMASCQSMPERYPELINLQPPYFAPHLFLAAGIRNAPCIDVQRRIVLHVRAWRCRFLKIAYNSPGPDMTRQQILDLYFMDARCKLIELAAFLDRVDRSEGEDDFRMAAFRQALAALGSAAPDKAREVLLRFSDPTDEPIAAATTKAACGAWPGSH